MTKTFALAAIMLGLACTPALAQEAQCYQNDQFQVIAQERSDAVGTDFIIRPPAKGKIACIFEAGETDTVLSNPDDPLHYAALVGQYLVLTRSTGPQGDLVIYDLSSELHTPLLDARAEDDIIIADQTVTYWQELILGTEVNCPQYAENSDYGLGSMIYEERILDLSTLTIAATGQTRCSSTQ